MYAAVDGGEGRRGEVGHGGRAGLASHGALTVMVSALPHSLPPSISAPTSAILPPLGLLSYENWSSIRVGGGVIVQELHAVDLDLFNGFSKRAMWWIRRLLAEKGNTRKTVHPSSRCKIQIY